MSKWDKALILFFELFFIGFIVYVVPKDYLIFNNIDVVNIKLENFNKENNIMTIKVTKKNNTLNTKFSCIAEYKDKKIEVIGKDNTCTFDLENDANYNLYLVNESGIKSNIYKLSNIVNNVLSFNFASEMLYLAVDEEAEFNYYDVVIDNEKIDYNFKSVNESIAKVNGNKVIGLSKGETYIYSDKIKEKLKIKVTDLITKPYATKDKKELLPCNAYTEEEAKELDEILEYKINNAGYQTRAGALAAARFLTLEFQYRVPYYYETGRIKYENKSCNMSNINTYIVDGEGRYYHKGLYLADSKKELITSSKEGPAIWGCKIRNLEKKPEYGFVSGVKMPNGLDCSGFVTWSLKNAGFEPGDVGAGEDPGRNCQCTDLGEFVPLTNDLLNSGKVKAGDLINWWGHIAMIIGIDKKTNTYYIAESLSYIGGVRAMIYTKSELLNTFKYVVLMDNFYKKDGNYSIMWN